MQIQDVDYTHYTSGGTIDSWIEACSAAKVPPNDAWLQGFKTLCRRESSDNPNAVNTNDRNAKGPPVQDGNPQGCSRGIAQCIPPTFADNHVAGTSVSIYDPVANIAAAIQYVRKRYHVSLDGSDLAHKVQQADPSRRPKGFDPVSGSASDWVPDQRSGLPPDDGGDVSTTPDWVEQIEDPHIHQTTDTTGAASQSK